MTTMRSRYGRLLAAGLAAGALLLTTAACGPSEPEPVDISDEELQEMGVGTEGSGVVPKVGLGDPGSLDPYPNGNPNAGGAPVDGGDTGAVGGG